MPRPHLIASAIAIWVILETLCIAQTAPQDALEQRIRRADRLQDEGALSEARDIYLSALKTLPAEAPTRRLGHVLNGLSNVSSSLGDHQRAVQYAMQAEEVYGKLGDADGQAYALNNKGIAEGELGDYRAAQATLRLALALSQQAGDTETQVRTLNNLGNVHYFPGQYLEALSSYQSAWKLLEPHSSEPWSDYWRQITRFNEATLYQRLGRYHIALGIYREVEKSKDLSSSDRAHLLTNLGVLYRRLGDSWKALDAYQSSLAVYGRQGDSVGEISALKNIGIVYALDRGDLRKAEQSFERALARSRQTHNQREEMQAHLYLGETKLRQMKVPDSQREFQLALAQARQLGTLEEQWKALYGMGRGEEILQDVGQAEKNFREGIAIIETTRAQLQLAALRAEFLADKRDVYDALISILLKKHDVQDAFLVIERSRARTFQDRLAQAVPGQNESLPPLTLEEVRGYLDPFTILLEFWTAGDELAVVWCTWDSCSANQGRFPSTEREALLSLLRRMPERLADDWRGGTALLARIFPEGFSLPPNLRHALIVPDGWLSSVPFDLVPFDESGTLLVERLDISHLPSAALLRRHTPARIHLHFPWTRELVAFGDPEVRENAAQGNFENEIAPARLPYSAEEIRSISRMVRGRREVFLGASNLKRTFLAFEPRGTPILHLSTHAFADAGVPENSRILFSPEPGGGANYLFLRELYEMDLRNVDLATLSACDTEGGKMIRGEGVQAFSRALLFAGARSTMTTLWRVADQPTSEFMKQFYYFALQKHQPKAEALRSAKLKFLRSGTQLENPAYWAGFVLSGDGMNPVPSFVSWSELVLGSVVAGFLVVFATVLLLRVRRRVNRVHRPENVVA